VDVRRRERGGASVIDGPASIRQRTCRVHRPYVGSAPTDGDIVVAIAGLVESDAGLRKKEGTREKEGAKFHCWYPHPLEETFPPVPGAPETTPMPVFVALAGMHGVKICSSTPMPEARGATQRIELIVPVTTPVIVSVTVAAAVAFALME
jgi:hypothetical protein